MKTSKVISWICASMLVTLFFFSTTTLYAQTKPDSTVAMMKDCCMKKDGKMMKVKGGKMMPMDKDMTMSNGTKCMVNGECVMKDGKKMTMKEGECMDMDGTKADCAMMEKKK
ncbi:MAG: DUF6799 domain-containing protein [Chryseolinea sp.]